MKFEQRKGAQHEHEFMRALQGRVKLHVCISCHGRGMSPLRINRIINFGRIVVKFLLSNILLLLIQFDFV